MYNLLQLFSFKNLITNGELCKSKPYPICKGGQANFYYSPQRDPVAEFIAPWLGEKVNSDKGLSYSMPELTLSPSQGSMNTATVCWARALRFKMKTFQDKEGHRN